MYCWRAFELAEKLTIKLPINSYKSSFFACCIDCKIVFSSSEKFIVIFSALL